MQYASSRLDGLSLSATVHDGSPSGCPAPSSLVSPFHGAQDPKLQRLLDILHGPMSVKEMMSALNFHSRDKFLKNNFPSKRVQSHARKNRESSEYNAKLAFPANVNFRITA